MSAQSPEPAAFPGALPSGEPIPYLADDCRTARRLLKAHTSALPIRIWFHATGEDRVPSIVTTGLIPSCWTNGDSCIVFGLDNLDELPTWRRYDWIIEVRSPAPPGHAKAWWVPPSAITGAWRQGTFTPRDHLPRQAADTAPILADGCDCGLADICREQQQRWRQTLSLR
jgi:hypothetical protein